jgi:DNA invertase Pin-like site-specific DNA recombinase
LSNTSKSKQRAGKNGVASNDDLRPPWKLVFHVFGALAEFERDLIRQRMMAGLAAARVRGCHGGRRGLNPEKTRQLRTLAADMTNFGAGTCTILGISRSSFYRCMKRWVPF